jgi:hypothetical protein
LAVFFLGAWFGAEPGFEDFREEGLGGQAEAER